MVWENLQPAALHRGRGRKPAFSWDAYVEVPDPDALAAEFASRGVTFSVPLTDSDDGLRGFVVKDVDG